MNNTYPIQQKVISQPGQPDRTATQVNIRCSEFLPFSGAVAYVEFIDEDDATIWAGNVPLTQAQFDAWGNDDSAFITAAAQNVGAVIL